MDIIPRGEVTSTCCLHNDLVLRIEPFYLREPEGADVTVTGLLGPAGSFGFLWNLYCLRKLITLGLVPLDIVTLNG